MFRLSIGLFFLAVVTGPAAFVQAEDFRVDNAIYDGDGKEPLSESTTIFDGGVVYDCMKKPAETVVFDDIADRYLFLNPARRERAELSTTELSALIDRLQKLALRSKDPVVRFLADPKFQEPSDDSSGGIVLSSPLVVYRVTLAPQENQGIVERYRAFCDSYARLNAILSPGMRPPFARFVVNEAMAKRQATASQVCLTIHMADKSEPDVVVRSEHRLVIPLEKADLDRVAEIRGQLDSFKKITFEKYRKGWGR